MAQWSIDKRPSSLGDLFGVEDIKKYFYARVEKGKDFPTTVLLHGQYGTGKTTVANIIAKMYSCKHTAPNGDPCNECPDCKAIDDGTFGRDCMLINGGMSSKQDVIEKIQDFTLIPAWKGKRKVVIIEEVQELSPAARNALLKDTETNQSGIHFILLSMERLKAGGFTSRAVPFWFRPLKAAELMFFLKSVLEKEGLWTSGDLSKEFKLQGLATIAENSDGSIRNAIQILEQVLEVEAYTPEAIARCTGFADQKKFGDILRDLLSGRATEALYTYLAEADTYQQDLRLLLKIIADAETFKVFGKTASDIDYMNDQANFLSHSPHFNFLKESIEGISHHTLLSKFEYISTLCRILDYAKGCQTSSAEQVSPTNPPTKEAAPASPAPRMVRRVAAAPSQEGAKP